MTKKKRTSRKVTRKSTKETTRKTTEKTTRKTSKRTTKKVGKRVGVREVATGPERPTISGVRDAPAAMDRLQLGGTRTLRQRFSSLDSEVPLALLPVRLETRFTGSQRGGDRALRVRIYPDAIQVDDHDPNLTEREAQLGRQFWKSWKAARKDVDKRAAIDWLGSVLPVRRAAWIAKATKGTGANDLETVETRRAARAAGLPKQWAVIGFTKDDDEGLEERFTKTSRAVRTDLAVGVDPTALNEASDSTKQLFEGDLAWMIDFEEAERAGMAVTIDLEDMADIARNGLAALVVCGVSASEPEEAGTILEDLFTAHHYSHGLGFALQGVATNNTDAADAGWTSGESDPIAFLERELFGAPIRLTRNSNAKRTKKALGLADGAVLGRVENGHVDEESTQAAMNRALWPVTWGQYLENLLAGEDGRSVVPSKARQDFKRRFLNDVRGGASLPSLRVGSQPYGILPVRYSFSPQQWTGTSPWFEHILLSLREPWSTASRDVVPRLDPVLGASGGSAGNDPQSVLVEMMSALPHPGRFLLRKLANWREEDVYDLGFGEIIASIAMPFLFLDDPTFGYEALSVLGRWGWAMEVLGGSDFLNLDQDELDALHASGLSGTDAQLTALDELRGRINSLLSSADDRSSAKAWIDSLKTLVNQYAERIEPLKSLAGLMLSYEGFIADSVDDPKLFYSLYEGDEETKEFKHPLVASEAASVETYLQALANRVPRRFTGPIRRSRPINASNLPGAVLTGGLSRGMGGGRSRTISRRAVSNMTASPSIAPIETTLADGALVRPDDIRLPGGGGLSTAFHNAEPLLYQLLDGVVEDVAEMEGSKYSQALELLGALSEDQLELRMRETLGLASYRLDAYFTSMARKRLDAQRKQADGIQLGSFGWVLDLVPDGKAALDSQGFVHAPSMQHATTAAILRSGWSVHGTESERSAMAVDLSGKRVREATWLLDGLRQGQELGELLGYRFERSLHEAERDEWIDSVRRGVLAYEGKRHEPRGPVDGLKLLETLDAADGDATSLVEGLSVGERVVFKGFVEVLQALFDAVGDAAVCESVHQVAQGNSERAAAVLDAVDQGDIAPPVLESLQTPVRGPGVIHRTLLLLGSTEHQDGWTTDTPRATFDPLLEAWLQQALGPATGITFYVRAGDDSEGPWRQVPLTDLGLAALDCMMEAPQTELGADSRWARRVAAHVRVTYPDEFTHGVAVEFDFEASPALFDLAEKARSARGLVAGAKPVGPEMLDMPGAESTDSRDLAEAQDRLAVLESEFRAASDALSLAIAGTRDEQALTAALLGLVGFEIPGALPASFSHGESESVDRMKEARSLFAVLEYRKADLDALAEEEVALDNEGAWPRLESRLAILLGKSTPLIPRFHHDEKATLLNAFRHGESLLNGDSAAVWAHLAGVAKVRPDTARLDELGMWMELLGDGAMPLRVAQLPHHAEDGWVANSLPNPGTGGRVHWIAHDFGFETATLVAGLVVDEWTERIPASEVTTGVAFHFDAPSSRAPQSMLLVVTPEEEPEWSLELVVATLLQTLELSKMRAVGPQSLEAYGHHLPAIFSPQTLNAGKST